MFACPHCQTPLRKVKHGGAVFWLCPSCDGRMATVYLLRRFIDRKFMAELVRRAMSPQAEGARRCPSCSRRMDELTVPSATGALTLDFCRICKNVWFDKGEFESAPPIPPQPVPVEAALPAVKPPMPVGEKETWEREGGIDMNWTTTVQRAVAFFAFPYEVDSQRFNRWPVITWMAGIIILCLSLLGFHNYQNVLADWAFIPAQWSRNYGATVFGSFFLHSGPLHLFGNLYFLLMAGDNVEDDLGHAGMLMLLAGAALAGDAAMVLLKPDSMLPCIGASGGISGVLTYYALKFPHNRIGVILFRGVFWFRTWAHRYENPAWMIFVYWIGLQAVGFSLEMKGIGHVAASAHLGGAAVGLLAWTIWRNK